jgi:mRNA interferase MazF
VVLVNFPFSDLSGSKPRPALIVQADDLSTSISQVIVALITTNLQRSGSTRVLFSTGDPAWQQMGLTRTSVVVTDNLATVIDREVYRALGHCPAMSLVDAALRVTLDL